jgi:threonyl-tRNA synthetase
VQSTEAQSTSSSPGQAAERADAAAKDLSQVLLPTSDESDQLLRIRHSSAHLMAMAMQRMHEGTQVTIGPWTDNGFYYDFDMSNAEPFTEKVLKKVKKEMRRLMRKDLPFVREEVAADEARRRITELGEPYKLEILDSILERCSLHAPYTAVHINIAHTAALLSMYTNSMILRVIGHETDCRILTVEPTRSQGKFCWYLYES